MESLDKEQRKKLGKVLAGAYRRRETPEAGDAWETRVMNDIRNISHASAQPGWSEMFGNFFWKLCPVACAIIIFLSFAVSRYNILVEQDYAQIIIDDIAEVTLLDPYNG